MLIIKLFLSLCFILLCLSHSSHAQNAPKEYVNAHNVIRAEVGVGPLVWNKTLARYARNYAKTRKADCAMQHSLGPYGENLAAAYEKMNAADAVRWWYTEKPDYDHAHNRCISGGIDCMHYTQMVWRDSVRVGCAKVKCTNKWVFIICNYDPPGNVVGEAPY